MTQIPWTHGGHKRPAAPTVRWDCAASRHYVGAWTDADGRECCLCEYSCPPGTTWPEFLLGVGFRDAARAHGRLPVSMILGNREAFMEWAELVVAFEVGDTARVDSFLRDLRARVDLPRELLRDRGHEPQAILREALHKALSSSPGTVLEKFLGLGQRPRLGREERHALLRVAVRKNATRILAKIERKENTAHHEVPLDENLPDPRQNAESKVINSDLVLAILDAMLLNESERRIANALLAGISQVDIVEDGFGGGWSPIIAFLTRARRAARRLGLQPPI